MNTNIKIKLSKNVLKRYEPNIDNGLFLLYNAKNKEFYESNPSFGMIINAIDGTFCIEEIINIVSKNNPQFSKQDIKTSLIELFNDLYEKGFIVENA